MYAETFAHVFFFSSFRLYVLILVMFGFTYDVHLHLNNLEMRKTRSCSLQHFINKNSIFGNKNTCSFWILNIKLTSDSKFKGNEWFLFKRISSYKAIRSRCENSEFSSHIMMSLSVCSLMIFFFSFCCSSTKLRRRL